MWTPSSTRPGRGPTGDDRGSPRGLVGDSAADRIAAPARRQASDRRAMTLVEVVAGLVLLTTVLAAVGVARGRFVRQWADADRQLRATRAADALLAEWLAGPPDRVPVGSGGSLPGADGFRWSARRVRDSAAERLGSQVVRLEVTRPDADGTAARGQPVLAVEFLLRDDRPSGGADQEVP